MDKATTAGAPKAWQQQQEKLFAMKRQKFTRCYGGYRCFSAAWEEEGAVGWQTYDSHAV